MMRRRTWLWLATGAGIAFVGGLWLFRRKGPLPSQQEVKMSLNELAVNLRQGQSLVDALKQTASKTNNAHLKSVWEEVLNDVLQGKSLSRAMAAHPEVFPPNLLAAVQQGERQGNLDVALLRYAGR